MKRAFRISDVMESSPRTQLFMKQVLSL